MLTAQKADFVQSRLEKHPTATAHAVCSGVIACRVCSWSAAEGRFRAIAAGETPLSAGMLAAFATGTLQNVDFMQSRPGRCPFGPECLSRLQLECRRRPFSCTRGWRNASFGRNACRVCSWSAAEGRFRAIAARRTPRRDCSRCMLRCDSWSECLPRLQLECRRRPFSCNRGWRNAPCGRNACRVCSWSAA